MKCNICGTELNGTEQICPVCGAPIAAVNPAQPAYVDQTTGTGGYSAYDSVSDSSSERTTVSSTSNLKAPAGATAGLILGILAVILSFAFGGFWLGIPGIIVSIIALKKCSSEGRPGKGKAIAGLVISGVSIFVTLIVGIMMAALAPSLAKYTNKSQISTTISDGTTVKSAMNAALASESAYNDAKYYYNGQVMELNDLLAGSDAFAEEVRDNLGRSSVEGSVKKDLNGDKVTPVYYVRVNIGDNYGDWYYDEVEVWYGVVDDEHMISPNVGTAWWN